MGIFRRKPENKKALDEHSGVSAPPERGADADRAGPEIEQSSSVANAASERSEIEQETHPGRIDAPAADSITSGIVGVEAHLADIGVPIDARLEWSRDDVEWSTASTPGDDYEILAALAGESSSRTALIRSLEPREQAKRSLAQKGFEQVELVAARPSSWVASGLFIAGWDTGGLLDGTYQLRMVTIGADESEIACEPVAVLIDNVGPEIELREKPSGRLLSGLVTLLVEAEDAASGVAGVELELSSDGKSWRCISEAHQTPYELHFDADKLTDGSYKLRVTARDGGGNVSTGDPFEIEIASKPSAAELVDLGEYLRENINLIARAPDKRSAQMVFEIAASGSNDWRALGTARPPFHLPVDTRPIRDGSYDLRIESISPAGLSTYSERFGPYVIDNTPPSVEIVEPKKGSELSETTKIVVGVSDEPSGPARVVLSFNEGEGWNTLAELEPEAGEVRGFWRLDACRPGDCQLRATAYDRAGNTASETVTIKIMSPGSESEPVPEAKPEPEPEPEKAVLDSGSPEAVHASSSEAATRFGSVPSWDWRRRSDAPEKKQAEKVSDEHEAATAPSPKPTVEKAATETKKRQPEVAAWSWKSRRTPAGDMRPSKTESTPEREPEPEQAIHVVESIAPDDAAAADEASPEPVAKEAEPEEKADASKADADTGGRLISFPGVARGWDIWRLSELVEDAPDQDPIRQEERRQILYHLRDHAALNGLIPPEFEGLVYEAFGDLIKDEPGH